MGWAEQLPTGEWRARWRVNSKKYAGETFKTRRAALIAADEEQERTEAGLADLDKKLTWGQWEQEWTPNRIIEASTRAIAESVIKKWVRPHWGNVKLAAITAPGIRQWLRKIQAEGATPHTVLKAYGQLQASLSEAVRDGKLRENPCSAISPKKDLPKAPEGPGLAFSVAEVEAIISVLAMPYKTAVSLLAFLGLRFGEMAGMHWADVHEDEADPYVWVSHTWSRLGREIKPTPKGASRRVDLPARVIELLQRPANWQEPCGAPHQDGTVCPGQLVLPGPHGAPLDSHNMMRRHWRPALLKAGVRDRNVMGRQHDLRHSYITWLIDRGMTAEQIGPIVGHSSAWITARYTHQLKGHGKAAAASIDSMLSDNAQQVRRLPQNRAVNGPVVPQNDEGDDEAGGVLVPLR